MSKEAVKYTTISLPLPLNDKLKNMIIGTGFNSVSSFATYVLRQIVSEGFDKQAGFTKADEEKVKGRLKSLGYLK